ncbi:4-alpha-glucanotransferase [Chitinophaga jiangningensis]|uniref:4-alpha-glucanotransferase n=1 Tax=Chitinophaga jiangningensis TaxID=1419482 RepID=A0A1M7CVA8_9BACT|nr:4-alpha-glucanotransferase [Chitinophaga jiangningensis]SHL71165.1 4-alpha-glucanotransferase [Chitinophaga jiangningensis]
MYYRLRFYLHYQTRFGQNLFLLGNIPVLGNNLLSSAVPMQWHKDGWWYAEVMIPQDELPEFQYSYIVRELEETITEGSLRKVTLRAGAPLEQLFVDTWNNAGDYENNWSTAPFTRVFFPHRAVNIPGILTATHLFKVKAPLLPPHHTICLLGSCPQLGNWNIEQPLLLQYTTDGCFTAGVNLPDTNLPVYYKYGVFDLEHQQLLHFETGGNRILHFEAPPGTQVTLHDGYVRKEYDFWKGTGVAVPVFSLRSATGMGTGEFADIPLLAAWAAQNNMQLIQLLPVNDTTITGTWTDSYPYAAISSFALHPLYIRLEAVGSLPATHALAQQLPELRQRLNEQDTLDYEAVMQFKLAYLRALYEQQDGKLESRQYWQWFAANEHWLLPYAAFSYLRDRFKTADFSRWSGYERFRQRDINQLIVQEANAAEAVRFYFFIQYHLHLQLKAAVTACRHAGLALKGDIPIGVARHSVETWMHPELFHMDMQAGAPPDSFTTAGQNWGFPTYNWNRMAADGYEWWRQRLQHMSAYFDAFRIDHILGFFRIWQIPYESVQGILGYFHPAVPVSREELLFLNINFTESRFCEPYITDQLLDERFGVYADMIKDTYLVKLSSGRYAMQPGFDTQRKIQQQLLPAGMKAALDQLLTDVLFIRESRNGTTVFHPRFDLMSTASFAALEPEVQTKLRQLYHHYFYVRQENIWRKEALRKLPYISKATDMLICGEDLGMVPACVPGVMRQLGILSLEIQRMPKHADSLFQSLHALPYLAVLTPSTHDMPALREWWEEDHTVTQLYWQQVLHRKGTAPATCSPDILLQIIQQHLQSPAMWRIFQLQELLAMDSLQPAVAPEKERINNPAVATHYWRYRIGINLEDLPVKTKEANGTASISI